MKRAVPPKPQTATVQFSFKPWLPGHDAPQPIRRRLDGEAWEYVDDDVNDAAMLWGLDYGFDLAAFDDWLESVDMPPDFGRQLLEFRQRALDAQRAKNEDAVDAWVLLLRLFLQRRGERQVLIPAAQSDMRYRKGQAQRRKGKPGSNDQIDVHGVDRNADIRAYHARLVAANRHDATSATATAFGVSRSTVQRALRNPSG